MDFAKEIPHPPQTARSVVRTPRSVGTGGGCPPLVARWGRSNPCAYGDPRAGLIVATQTARADEATAKPLDDPSRRELQVASAPPGFARYRSPTDGSILLASRSTGVSWGTSTSPHFCLAAPLFGVRQHSSHFG